MAEADKSKAGFHSAGRRAQTIGTDMPADEAHRLLDELEDHVWSGEAVAPSLIDRLRQSVDQITPRHCAIQGESSLRESYALLHAVTEGVADAVFVKDTESRYRMINGPGARRLGKTVSEVIGRDDAALFDPATAAQRRADDLRIMAEGRTLTFEETRTVDGSRRTYLTIKAPHRDPDGRIIGVLGISHDITERKAAEEALKRFNEELEQRVAERTAQLQATVEELRRSNEDLERFAYISSHDLQEPLRMIGGYVGLLAHKYRDALDGDAREYIRFAEEGAVRMSNLIKDLLTYSRVNAQGRPPTPTDTGRVLRDALKDLELQMRETSAEVTYDDLPTVPADETQLGQVFQNLLSNALKFSRDGEPPKVHIAVELRDGQWLFSIRDHGIGIEPEYHDQIFIPFKRLHADRDRYPGSGIGLAIVKRIVERHHGHVCVESVLGKGSTFYFTLPASPADLD